MYDECANKAAARFPRCLSCAQPMQLLRRTSRFGDLPDLYTFYCRTCDEWHVEEGDAITSPLPGGGLATLAANADPTLWGRSQHRATDFPPFRRSRKHLRGKR